jgi:2-dehydro-3-deoxygluconokinase
MVLCFGELLLRLQPRLQARTADLYIGGAEANVAASLAQWGMPVQYVSVLPQHDLSQAVVSQLETLGIQCGRMLYGGERIGTYYLQPGADMKAASVIYDRQHSAFAELRPGTVDWASILQNIHWLHWSAITPALNERMPIVMQELLQTAHQMGITISVDLNYRPKLWQYGVSPVQPMQALLPYCHIAMGNLWAVESLLGIPSPLASSEGQSQQALLEAAQESLWQLRKAYPDLQSMAYTFRMADRYWGLLQQGTEMATSATHALTQVVDKVGTGDSLMAGLVFGLQQPGWNVQQRIDFAAAAAVSKFAVPGDFNTTPLATIQSMANIV